MANNEELIKRIDQLQARIDYVQPRLDLLARTTEGAHKHMVEGLTRRVDGISKQANTLEDRLKSLTLSVASLEGSNDMRREDIQALREELKHTQLDFGKRLTLVESIVADMKEIKERLAQLEAVEARVIIPDASLDIADLRRRVAKLEASDWAKSWVRDAAPEFVRKPKKDTPKWHEVVDNQMNVTLGLGEHELKSALLYHMSRVYSGDQIINALARIIALVGQNKHLKARDHRDAYVVPKVLARAIVESEWQRIIDIAATMLAVELEK